MISISSKLPSGAIKKATVTIASVLTKKNLPPHVDLLMEQAFAPYRGEIKLAVRAWERHVGRNEADFWGKIDGRPIEKDAHVRTLVAGIIANHASWNVFEHYKHGHIYEIRVKTSHGIRWSFNSNSFIGFVEPF